MLRHSVRNEATPAAARIWRRQVAADLRALGPRALLRGAYEASKGLGGHALVFGRLSTRQPPPPLAPALRHSGRIPEEARWRTLEEARSIREGSVQVFGKSIALAPEPNWHDTLNGGPPWPVIPWWRVDIRSDRRPADVKWTWELARHRHLVVLARAIHLDPEDRKTAWFLSSQLRSWIEQNPPELGVHWYSNLEIALRALAWMQVLDLAGAVLPERVVADMTRVLYHSGRHLVADLPYTLSSMRNNHLLGDGLGLVALGKSFPTDGPARRWATIGDRIFVGQLRRHVRPDGSMVEDSLGYHRFVLEMLCTRVLLGEPPDPVGEALLRSAQFLARLGVGNGLVPQHGDWDEGRVLATADDPGELPGSLRLALSLAGTGAFEKWRAEHDEVCWYVPAGEPVPPDPPECGGRDVGGGIARARHGRFTVWLKAGSGPSHGHADLCSTAIATSHGWVVGDPGTGSYNGPLEQRNYFRSSSAHNVLRLGDTDQLEPHRAFRWRHSASGRIGPPVGCGDGIVLWGLHDAYCRLRPPRQVVRAVILRDGSLTVADWVSGPPSERFALSLPLAPNASWVDDTLVFSNGQRLGLRLPVPPNLVYGSLDPYAGWWSDRYGQTLPAVRLEITGVVDGPVWWAAGVAEDQPKPHCEGGLLKIGTLQIAIEWGTTHARLLVDDGELEQVALLTVPA